jgi:hypothetical protein
MPPPSEHTVTSLTGFTDLVEQSLAASRALYGPSPSVVNWYRGSGRSNTYKLLPTLYRHPATIVAAELLLLERKMLEWFRRESVLHETITQYIDPAEPELELLFFMQHYSVPTRLLDWTMNPFIALYFALTAAEFDESTNEYIEDAAVWILNPNAWNEQSLAHVSWGSRGALSIEDVEKRGYAPMKELDPVHVAGMYALPAAMRGIANSSRMFAQKGVFTIFGRDTSPMEVSFDTNSYKSESLVKLIISKDDISALMDSVISIGYTDSVSYPDLHGLAMEMRRTFGFKV